MQQQRALDWRARSREFQKMLRLGCCVRGVRPSSWCAVAALVLAAAACTDAASPQDEPAPSADSPANPAASSAAGASGADVAATPTGSGEALPPVTAAPGGLGAGQAAAETPRGNGGSPGAAGAGGAAATPAVTCDLPASFRWTSSQPLISPQPPAGREFASIKDPSIVFFEGKYHVFATVYETTAGGAGWKSVYLSFTDFAQADAAPQAYMPSLATGATVAPQVFFFAPQNRWYLIYQWGARYSTNDDINNPNGWSAPRSLLAGEPANALDFWVICDDANCHLFFSRDDGVLYKSKTAIENFPNFSGYEVVMQEPSAGLLFEASNVYQVEGTNQYLLLVEAYGPRYFRSWTSESLDGPWAPLAATQQNPFAGAANVTFDGDAWTNDISHGEMIRSGYDQKLTINACKLQYLYQGTAPNFQGDYNAIPYRLGLITQQ